MWREKERSRAYLEQNLKKGIISSNFSLKLLFWYLDKFLKGPLPTLMHCALRTQIWRISCCTKLLIVVKGFSKDLVLVQTAQAIRSKKIVIRANGSGYPFEKEISSLRTTQAIRSNGSSYQFKIIVSCATAPWAVG